MSKDKAFAGEISILSISKSNLDHTHTHTHTQTSTGLKYLMVEKQCTDFMVIHSLFCIY